MSVPSVSSNVYIKPTLRHKYFWCLPCQSTILFIYTNKQDLTPAGQFGYSPTHISTYNHSYSKDTLLQSVSYNLMS